MLHMPKVLEFLHVYLFFTIVFTKHQGNQSATIKNVLSASGNLRLGLLVLKINQQVFQPQGQTVSFKQDLQGC